MLTNPYSIFSLFFVTITSYHTFVSQSWCFCLLSALLWFHCLHILYCYLFLANWSMHSPALNFQVYNWDRMYRLDFFSFNIVGLSSPLLPCRLTDLRRGLIYSKNLQHPPLLSSHSTAPPTDCTSAPDSPFHCLEHSLRPTSLSVSLLLLIECKLCLVSWSLLRL